MRACPPHCSHLVAASALLFPGVRVGVPATTSLLSRSYQARQFEYHYSLPLMGIGTINGEVMLSNWETQRVLGCELLPGATTPIHEPSEHTGKGTHWKTRHADHTMEVLI